VASNWGKDKQADWYLNLKKDLRAGLEVNGKIVSAVAHEAQGEEYDRLWKFTTECSPPYLEYQKMTTRHIPIMVFERVGCHHFRSSTPGVALKAIDLSRRVKPSNTACRCSFSHLSGKASPNLSLVPHPFKFSHELSFKIEVVSLILPVVAQPPG
jgi:hypothetical protein